MLKQRTTTFSWQEPFQIKYGTKIPFSSFLSSVPTFWAHPSYSSGNYRTALCGTWLLPMDSVL